MNRFVICAFAALVALGAAACGPSTDDIPLAPGVDLQRYTGLWYEIARLPVSFERGLVCVTARYTPQADGSIEVLNRGRRSENRALEKSARGRAWVPDPRTPGRLMVSFFFPFRADYRVIALDTQDYRWAMVTSGSREYLWILSRTPVLEAGIYERLVAQAASQGFDTQRLILVPQDCRATD